MLINKVAFFGNFQTQNKNSLKNEKIHSEAEQKKYPMPTAAHYASSLSFNGGYSIDLKKTIEKLEEYETKHQEKIFPPLVKEKAKDVIESGNPDDLTLIDIHKQVYSDVSSIDNLEDLKLFYPEFEGVKSVGDVEFNKGSFIDKVQNNEFASFNAENELSLDLVKLLYAEGLSTNDIKEYTGGVSIYPTAVKLGVPLLNPQYAHILKFSDKEYNERLTRVMSENSKDSKERKLQNGEPVFIPRRPLTEEHKAHISESLKKYYEENPEKLFELSKRQREFYAENPDRAEKFTQVLLLAWKNSYSVKKALSKHFKKELGREVSSEQLNPLTIEGENKNILKSFWKRNPWAKDVFSKNMKKAWEKVKSEDIEAKKETIDEYTKYNTLKTVPTGFIADFDNWKKENGITEPTAHNPIFREDQDFENRELLESTQKLIGKFCDEHLYIQDAMADTYSITTLELADFVDGKFGKSKNTEERAFAGHMKNYIYKELMALNGEKGYLTTEEAGDFYQTIYTLCINLKNKQILDFLSKKVDENYIKYKKMHTKKASSNS